MYEAGPIMSFHNQDREYPVGAQFIGAPPIYRPGEGINAPPTTWPVLVVKFHHRAATPLSRSVNLTPMERPLRSPCKPRSPCQLVDRGVTLPRRTRQIGQKM